MHLQRIELERQRSGFTLVEMVVVVLIMGIIAAGAMPRMAMSTQSARSKAAKKSLVTIRYAIELDGFEDPRLKPAPRLLVHGRPGREIVRQESPLTTRSHHVSHRIEQLPQRIVLLRRVLAHQGEVRHHKLPFRIRDVAGIRLPCRAHAATSSENRR